MLVLTYKLEDIDARDYTVNFVFHRVDGQLAFRSEYDILRVDMWNGREIYITRGPDQHDYDMVNKWLGKNGEEIILDAAYAEFLPCTD